MSQLPLYFSVQLLEDYLDKHCTAEKPQMSMHEAVTCMRDEGLLLTDGKPKALPSRGMDDKTFYRLMNELPVDACGYLQVSEEEFWERYGQENTAFRPNQSVSCVKLIEKIYRRPVKREYFEFYYIKRGGANLLFEDNSFPLQTGDLCILPPMSPHVIEMEEGSFILDAMIRASTFDARFGETLTMAGAFSGFFRESLYGKGQPNFLMMHTRPGDSLIDMCLRGAELDTLHPDRHSDTSSVCWIKLMLCYALRSCDDKVEIYRLPISGNPRADCGEILQYIQQNYRTVRLSTLAQEFHYNETYLSRMLQNYAQQSFTEIVREIRMNRAVEYLTQSSLRVHEIAGLVGYSSVDHFSRAFKATYGESPQSYRRENRNLKK